MPNSKIDISLIPYIFCANEYSKLIRKLNLLYRFSNIVELYEFVRPLIYLEQQEKSILKAKFVQKKHEIGNVQTIDFYHEYYPTNLKEIPDPPIQLFVRGNLELLNLSYIGVVGTRKPSSITVHACKYLSSFVSKMYKSGIISGMADGIDKEAMKVSLQCNLPTIGVIATGLDIEYPYSNRELYKSMKESRQAAILTEIPMGEQINKWSFPRRNRIITGISELLLIMEAPIKSGAMSSASHAISQSKEILIFSHKAQQHNQGGQKLINDGANELSLESLTTKSEDIFHITEIAPIEYTKTPEILSIIGGMILNGEIDDLGGGFYRKISNHTQ